MGYSLLGCRRVRHDLATEQQLKVLVLEMSVQVMLLLNVRLKLEFRLAGLNTVCVCVCVCVCVYAVSLFHGLIWRRIKEMQLTLLKAKN